MGNLNIFLDTCVILKREFSSDQEKSNKIKRFLEQKNKVTSTYVCMELNRTFLADAETLEVLFCEVTDLKVIWEKIRKYSELNVRDRLELLFHKITEDTQSLYEAKSILKRLIKHYHSILLRGVTIIPSRTECEKGLYIRGYICRGTKSTCKVTDVVEENKPLFESIRTKLVENLQKDRKTLRICWTLNEITGNPSKTREDPRNCFDIGDILIALDVPESFTLVSEDKGFFLICEVLNVPFYHIDL